MMIDQDTQDLRAWANRAFGGQPPTAPPTDDVARGRTALTARRRQRITVVSTAAAAIAAVMAVEAGASLRPEPPDHAAETPSAGRLDRTEAAGSTYADQRRELLRVATSTLGLSRVQIRVVTSDQPGDAAFVAISPGEAGEEGVHGVAMIGITEPGLSDAELRARLRCDDWYVCEQRQLPDGTSAWVGEAPEGALGAAYQQSDGESVYFAANPPWAEPALDVSIDQALAFVTDERLEYPTPWCGDPSEVSVPPCQ
jgi:hypothetical protein